MHSHTRLEFILEAVPALIGYVDLDERYRFNNLAYQDWFGRPVEEFVGRTVRDVLGDVAYATVAPHVRRRARRPSRHLRERADLS